MPTCSVWNVPFLPVMPWQMTLVLLSTNTAGPRACEYWRLPSDNCAAVETSSLHAEGVKARKQVTRCVPGMRVRGPQAVAPYLSDLTLLRRAMLSLCEAKRPVISSAAGG